MESAEKGQRPRFDCFEISAGTTLTGSFLGAVSGKELCYQGSSWFDCNECYNQV